MFNKKFNCILINIICWTGILQLLQTRTSRRFFVVRLTPEMEKKMVFLCTDVKFGNQKRYQEWFQRQVRILVFSFEMSWICNFKACLQCGLIVCFILGRGEILEFEWSNLTLFLFNITFRSQHCKWETNIDI